MTSVETQYERDHVAKLLPENITDTLHSRYLKSWDRWLAWCQEHDLQPGEARRIDVTQFVQELPPYRQVCVQRDLARVYSVLGGANPARRLRSLTPEGIQKHQRRWNIWAYWCEQASVDPLPADPDQLAAFLDEVERKKSPRYAERSLETISRIHLENELPDPQRTAPVIIQKIADIKVSRIQATKPHRPASERSPSTVRRDESIWKRWSKWCDEQGERGIDPLSAKAQDIAAFLSERRSTGSYPYIRVMYNSLKGSYKRLGLEQNPVESDIVQDTLRTLKNVPDPRVEEGSPAESSDEDYGFPEPNALQHLADRSRRTYRSYWRLWSEWCLEHGIDPLDASSQELTIFLTEEAVRLKVKSVELYVAAIGCVYEISVPDRDNPARDVLVKRTMRGLKLLHRSPPSQVKGLMAEDLARIQATATRPQTWETERQALVRGTTDLAIIGVMRDAMLRVSEAAAITWDDLEEEEDGSGRLTIAHSKTDQEGEGATLFISSQTMEWLKEMREMVVDGPTIFGVNQNAIYHHIVDAVNYAGLEGRYGGHSPRIGMALDLARANASLLMMMQAGRWKSPEMPAKYIRNMAAGHNAVAQWYNRHPGRAIIDRDD